ncbi:MAG TPA: kelch repeat-containing protein [Candidatus Binatus sp.]|uniref:Kelch repeat-containing protein n=1 Tax=Candidatus Binatus sp. TaxID=2811406 RepID=UPI002F4172E9
MTNNRRRFWIWLGLMVAAVPVMAALIAGHVLAVSIMVSPDTPALMPDDDELTLAAKVTLPASGDVLIAGGMGSGKKTMKTLASSEFYDPVKGAFSQTGALPATAAISGATALSSSPGAKVVAFGGISGKGKASVALLSFSGTVLSGAELYDPSVGSWTATANSLSVPRAGATATLLGSGNVLIAGGFNASEVALNTAEIFNPTAGTFTATDNNMTDPRAHHTATLLSNGKVLLVSGLTDNNGTLSQTADIFDPSAGTHGVFTESAGFPAVGAAAAAVLFPSGPRANEVLITGGDGCGINFVCSSQTAQIYDPVADSFSVVGSMTEFRLTHTATLIRGSGSSDDGKVLVAGGVNVEASLSAGTVPGAAAFTTISKSAELFDPVSETFTCIGGAAKSGGCNPSMKTSRAGHTATLLNNGTVLIAGGFAGYGRPGLQMGAATKEAEIFTPTTNTFKKTKSMHFARGGQTALLLP